MIDREQLISLAADYGVQVSEAAAEKLDRYAELLVEWNEKMNLTAITDPQEILLKHFVDSLTGLPFLPEGPLSLIDVGTGAGFPGVPLAVVRGDIRLTLLDSLNKRLIFLGELCKELSLPVTLIHARAEEGGRRPDLRDGFDVATARAVAPLPTLCEYCLPFVKPGGFFLAMKGPDGEAEMPAAERAMTLLSGKLREVQTFQLPLHPAPGEESYERRLIFMDKIGKTPPAYPRPTAKIVKRPL